jgi:hypothetical protein
MAVAHDSWKAKQIATAGEVSVTVPIRRGGVLALVLPIPPATVSFHATAKVHPAGSPEARSALKELASLLPPERRVIFLQTYGRSKPLPVQLDWLSIASTAAARASPIAPSHTLTPIRSSMCTIGVPIWFATTAST